MIFGTRQASTSNDGSRSRCSPIFRIMECCCPALTCSTKGSAFCRHTASAMSDIGPAERYARPLLSVQYLRQSCCLVDHLFCGVIDYDGRFEVLEVGFASVRRLDSFLELRAMS